MTSSFPLDDDRVVVVIGSGASGGVVAEDLCRHGINVVLLEAGPRIGSEDFVQDENAAYAMLAWQDPQLAAGNWRIARDCPETPTWLCKAVGGTTIHWTGTALRFQDFEFKALSTYGRIEGAAVCDWPISLDDLRPYYERAELRMGVSGTNGLPQHPVNNHFKVMHHGATRAGFKQINRGRLAINAVPFDGRPASPQDGFTLQGDRSRAKWSTAYVEIPRALATGHLDLRPQCQALLIEHDEDGRAEAVVYADPDGRRCRQRCSIVVVACNAVQTPRLLLASASGRFPTGMGNASGHLGRYWMRHNAASTWSIFDRPVRMYRGEMMPGLISDPAVHDPSRGFSGGYFIELLSLSLPALAPTIEPGWWGKEFAWFIERYGNMAGLYANGEDLPQRDNRVSLHPSRVDRNGAPIPVIEYQEHPNDLAMQKHAYAAMNAIHREAGALCSYDTPPWPASHNMGTARMSQDPTDGVTDPWGRLHDVENVFVADGSVFASSASANPTLTIVALALRQSEKIIAQLKESAA